MAHYGGQFNPYNPISRLYETSRLAISSPGPGNYGEEGAPDPNLSNRGAGMGKTSGGGISGAVRETDADLMSKRGSKIPGPGHYDTDHIYGIYSRIMSATMDPTFAKSKQLRKHSQIFTADLEDTIFDQRLVMSRKIPLDSLMKLGSTRFSRLGKDLHPVKVGPKPKPPQPQTLNPEPSTLKPQPSTSTPDPHPSILSRQPPALRIRSVRESSLNP